MMKTKTRALICLAILPLLAGCASQTVTLSPVGPGPVNQDAVVPSGRLKVFSDTESHCIGDGPPYYPHTGYQIYDESGRFVKYVPNHIGVMDESPTLVSLPEGTFNVMAESSSYGRVTVPVIIQSGRTTVVHLDRGWRPSTKVVAKNWVHLPDGEVVGWSGATSKFSQ